MRHSFGDVPEREHGDFACRWAVSLPRERQDAITVQNRRADRVFTLDLLRLPSANL
jgi:hypothetical protein